MYWKGLEDAGLVPNDPLLMLERYVPKRQSKTHAHLALIQAKQN